MTEADAEVTDSKKISLIWVLPIAVLVIGGWIMLQQYLTEGPKVEITFKTAEGLEVGRTKVKALSVEVGSVEGIRLADGLDGVIVSVQMNPDTHKLLRHDSKFWVVRPQVNAEGISGLGTLLSGAYIELYPGSGEPVGRDKSFKGLEGIPRTPPGVAGMHITLYGDSANSINVGAPILHRGLRVGQVEKVELDFDRSEISIEIFIDAPYDQLLTEGTRFWNTSGLSISANTDGVSLSVDSLTSLVAGGIAFGVPNKVDVGEKVSDDARFRLYNTKEAAQTNPYQFGKQYILNFEQSIRGLKIGAPVTFRGIQVGEVEEIRRDDLTDPRQNGAASVIIRIEPARFGMPDSSKSIKKLEDIIKRGVIESGLRATLQTGSLLSGALFVSFDNYTNQPAAKVGEHKGMDSLPTLSSGIERLGQQLSHLMEKLNGLPVKETTEQLNKTLKATEKTVASINKLLSRESVGELPKRIDETLLSLQKTINSYSGGSEFQGGVNRTLQELESTMRKVDELVNLLEEKPNALVFPVAREPDPEPKAAP